MANPRVEALGSDPGLSHSQFDRFCGVIQNVPIKSGLLVVMPHSRRSSTLLEGFISYAVERRSREFGIRMALGAPRENILGTVLRQGLRVSGIGVAIGLICAWSGAPWLESFLFGVSGRDLTTYVFAGALLLVVSIAANLIPARRAARVDPLTSLRYE